MVYDSDESYKADIRSDGARPERFRETVSVNLPVHRSFFTAHPRTASKRKTWNSGIQGEYTIHDRNSKLIPTKVYFYVKLNAQIISKKGWNFW